MIEQIAAQASKWNSKRLVAAGGAGYAVYTLAAASIITGPLAGGILAGLAVVYIVAETTRPTGPERRVDPGDESN